MPEMTVALQVTTAERLSRTTSNALSTASTDASGNVYTSDVTRQYLNFGVEDFAKTGKLSKQDFVTVTPTFWGRTNWYFQITIEGGNNALAATNVAVVESDVDRVSGSTLATHLATNINAAIGTGSIAVGWDDKTWQFSISDNTVASITSINITSPSDNTNYIDGTEKTFGKTGEDATSTWLSSFPQDCTLEASLPGDFMEMEYVDYDDHLLYPAPFDIFMSPETNSTYPTYYSIRDRKIYIAPVPSDRRMLKIRYRYLPEPVTLTGSSDSTTCALPKEVNMAPVYYAAGMILRGTFEHEEADRMFQLYYDLSRKYEMRQANQNSKMFPKNVDFYVPLVNVDQTVR